MVQPETPSGELSPQELVRVVWRRRWLVSAVALTCAASAFVSSKFTTKVYQASATIRITLDTPKSMDVVGALSMMVQRESLATEIEVLKSRALAERVVTSMNLTERPGYGGDVYGAAMRILAGLSVVAVRDTSIVRITLRHPDPVAVTEIVNSIAASYVQYTLDRMHSEARSVRVFLDAQLQEVRGRLEKSQAELLDYQRKEGIVSIRGEGAGAAGLGSFTLTNTANEVAGFRGQLTGLHVQRAALLSSVSASHPRTKLLDAEIRSVQARLDVATARLNELQDKQFRLLQLEQNVRVEELTYNDLLSRFNQARVAENVDVGSARVLDLAINPGPPVKPNTRTNTVIGFLIGILLGLAAAIVLDRIRDVVRDPGEAERVSGLATLGFVPRLAIVPASAEHAKEMGGAPGIATGELIAVGKGKSAGAESFRTLRTNLKYVSPDRPVRMLVVTSGGPGDGKTTVAANLALSMAGGGQRVLLVDADMRKASIHKLFGFEREPGLSEILASQQAWSDVARTTSFERLSVVTGGKVPPNAADLVDSARMRTVLQDMAKEYDVLVVDSPPVGLVTDAQILAAQADATILVIRSGRSHRGAVAASRELLGRVGAKMAGLVLNDVSARAGYYYGGYGYYRYGYGYGYGYGSAYGYGYGERDAERSSTANAEKGPA